MAENSCFGEEDHEEQLQRDQCFQKYHQEATPQKNIAVSKLPASASKKAYKENKLQSLSQHHVYRKHEKQNKDSGIGSPSERNGEKSYSNNVHSTSKFFPDPATSKFSPKSSTSSNSSSSANYINGRSNSLHHHQPQNPISHHSYSCREGSSSSSSSNLTSDSGNYTSRGSRTERLYVASGCGSVNTRGGSRLEGYYGSSQTTRQTILGRFRSQTNIANLPFPVKLSANGSSKSVMTSPVDHPPSPVSLKGSSGNLAGSNNGISHGAKSHKPKKWFSFTNLLSRQNLTGILNIPKSRLSVSSTLNSVFVGPNSPSPSTGDSCPESGKGSDTFFNGCNNLNGELLGSSSPGNVFNTGFVPPPSPTPSCATVSGEFPTRSLSAGANSNSGQVVFRRKTANSNCGGARNSGSSSGTSSTATNFNISGVQPSGTFSTSGGGGSTRHYSSGSGCGNNSETASERSSGIGYSSYNSTAGSTASIGLHYATNAPGNNRLSCGEFFTGTPNSPIYSTGTPSDFPFQFSFGSENPLGQFENGSGIGKGCRSDGTNLPYFNSKKALGRSLPALLEAMETGSSCPGSPENGYAHVSVESVASLLYQEYVILTGAKSRSDHYLMIFPDRGNFQLLSDEDYRRLMVYLTSVPPMQDAESGFVLIIDRRNDKWNSVKTTLIRISSYFPGLIHRVFVLRPVGFIQKALSEVSTKLFRTENLKFRLTVCNNVSDLGAYVEPSQLLAELGGYLCYDKVKWVQQRTEVEAFYTALQALSKDLKSFTESFQDLEYPNDVVSTEELIREKESCFERLKLDLVQSGEHGEHLLKRIKHSESSQSLHSDKRSSKSSKNGEAKATGNLRRANSSTQLINVISVERFIIQIEETARLFEDFWEKEKHTLEQCLKLRRFEQDFRELQAIFDANTRILNDLSEVGENLEATDTLIAETLTFEMSTTDDISRALQVEQFGREIVDTNPSAVDTVEPKCAELARVTSNFKAVIQEKIAKQKEWREVQFTIEKANRICTEGMDLMTSPVPDNAEDCPESGTSILSQIDNYLDKIQPVLDELQTLKGNLKSPSSSQSKTLVKQVLKRVEDVQLMCAKRRSLVVQQITKSKSRRSSGSSLVSTPGSVSSSGTGASQNSAFPNELKSAKSTSQLDYSAEEYSSSSLRSGSSSLSLDGSNNLRSNGKCEESWELRRVKRGHVLNELLQTERTYVEEIGDVLLGYYAQIENPSLKSLLPSQLQPVQTKSNEEKPSRNISVLFCNLEEIHAFHEKLFLPDLSACIQSVELVGLCFIQRHAEFLSMYSQYCQLLPASENLRKEIREDHPWFLACRNRLGHKLPLGAYLLKPVQRITKYHLLLKDLVRNSEGCEGFHELVEALECMLVVLRCVNDGMHQLGIRGYKGKLIEEGYLLQQGSFLLWTETKKDRLRIKGHERHLFLYQKSILICKKKASSYEFRDKLNMSEIGLTEALKGSGAARKFEIWVNGRQKVYVLQAETQEMKDLWVKEIKKLLLEQLESLRAIKSQANGIPPVTSSVITTSIPHTAAGKRQRMMGNKGVTMNGWRNAHLQHRPLRQVCSWDSGDPKRPKSRNVECEIDEEQWSSEMSNSEDEDSTVIGSSVVGADSALSVYGIGQNVEDSPKYVALADYNAMGTAEISVKEGDIVTLVKVGCAGWWFVKSCNSNGDTLQEGWAPSAYLERMDNHGKLPVENNRNGGSTSTSPHIEAILSANKLPTNSYTPCEVPTTTHFGTREFEKIANDIVTALR